MDNLCVNTIKRLYEPYTRLQRYTMKTTKIICIITNIMFAIAAGILAILAVGTIQIMNLTTEIRNVINNNAANAISYVFLAAYTFTIILILIAIVLQLICATHSLHPRSKLKTNSIMKTCVAGIDAIIMTSFALETQETYAYTYLAFCILLLCLSIAQLISMRKA